eukprot:351660-Chlamydomonas_euryale.AAC.4
MACLQIISLALCDSLAAVADRLSRTVCHPRSRVGPDVVLVSVYGTERAKTQLPRGLDHTS